jgi:hypothetical protein
VSNIVLRQDSDGRMVVTSQLPSKMTLPIEVVVQYFAISDQWRARTNGLNRASGEPFISEPYKNPVFAVCNLLLKLANYTDPDSSLALEAALNSFLPLEQQSEPAKPAKDSTTAVP